MIIQFKNLSQEEKDRIFEFERNNQEFIVRDITASGIGITALEIFTPENIGAAAQLIAALANLIASIVIAKSSSESSSNVRDNIESVLKTVEHTTGSMLETIRHTTESTLETVDKTCESVLEASKSIAKSMLETSINEKSRPITSIITVYNDDDYFDNNNYGKTSGTQITSNLNEEEIRNILLQNS